MWISPNPHKAFLYPDRIEITSYPGPVPGIEPRHLTADADAPAAPARNRRIGQFLKELGLAEGRLSGLPKVFRAMADNGSPEPRFEFDEARTYFRATLPAHPEYGALSALRDAAHLRALGEHEEASRRIESAWDASRTSAALAAEMVRLHSERGDFDQAEGVLAIIEWAYRELVEPPPDEPEFASDVEKLLDGIRDWVTREVLEFVNNAGIRCTCGAIAGLLRVHQLAVGRYLGERRPETSWIVNGDTSEPTGYSPEQKHPNLHNNPEIIRDPQELRERLNSFRQTRGKTGSTGR